MAISAEISRATSPTHNIQKYALGLELEDPGFDRSVLSEFRTRLARERAEQLLLDKMLTHFREAGLLKLRGHARTDSTHVLVSVRQLHKLEMVGETVRATLNGVAAEGSVKLFRMK